MRTHVEMIFFLTVKSIKQKKTHMDFSYLHTVQNRKDR